MEAIVVGANVIERDGEVLLVQEGKDGVAGTWNLPAGRMEPTEDPVECARREAVEEIGLEVEPASMIGTYLDRSPAVDGDDVLVFVFHSRVIAGNPTIRDADSVVDHQWIRPSRLEGTDVRGRYVTVAVEDYAKGASASTDLVTDLRDRTRRR